MIQISCTSLFYGLSHINFSSLIQYNTLALETEETPILAKIVFYPIWVSDDAETRYGCWLQWSDHNYQTTDTHLVER